MSIRELLHSLVCFLYFPPPLKNALMFTTISLDAISILPIWLLLAFSSTVREAVIPKEDWIEQDNRRHVVGRDGCGSDASLQTLRPIYGMSETWIAGYRLFRNETVPFDSMEPYSTIVVLSVALPTFITATHVYAILIGNLRFRGNGYFHIFVARGIVDLFAFLTNLLRFRLAIFETFASIYVFLGDSAWATALCAFAILMPRAQLVAQCLLSVNRLLAVLKPLGYHSSTLVRRMALAVRLSSTLTPIVDRICSRRVSPLISHAIGLSFQFSLIFFAFLCNCALIFLLATRKNALKTAGRGLVITTLAHFLTYLAYAIIVVLYSYFPSPLSNASKFTTMALDSISLLPVWLLLMFSRSVRRAALRRLQTWPMDPFNLHAMTSVAWGSEISKRDDMERPVLFYFLLPFTIISLVLYARILVITWRKSSSLTFNTFFYKQMRSQAFLDISFVVMYLLTESPAEWPHLWHLLTDLNGTLFPQLMYCHTYLCILGLAYGITLIALNRMLLVCYPTSRFSMQMDTLRFRSVLVLHMTPPLGQAPSTYAYVPAPPGITRMTEGWSVRLNSDLASAVCFTGAFICAICYVLIFFALSTRPMHSWRKDLPLIITSFFLFLTLCLLAMFFFMNRFWVGIDMATLYFFRKHFYLVSFPVALINPCENAWVVYRESSAGAAGKLAVRAGDGFFFRPRARKSKRPAHSLNY
ncbi:srv-21 [Pristionchus pacificus]|uniref:Serpentine receptor class gamma n=1 Tax=Pristionchus pacificus TaxID=54126 RepID=A0A2A6CQU3_PRIPA|nr:srv-21 [Pristionchus pacificus]|eukprot:PDM80427.1 G protein-coupled receptor [Pristionchus pacificus]